MPFCTLCLLLLHLFLGVNILFCPGGEPTMVGGETGALNRLKSFAADCQARLTKGNQKVHNSSVFGTNFSCKISPWLAMGSISPCSMFNELKKTISASTTPSTPRNGSGDTRLNLSTNPNFLAFLAAQSNDSANNIAD